ncbi:MAG: DUF481 domain-containing protein, partial [Myxococcota bacterium]
PEKNKPSQSIIERYIQLKGSKHIDEIVPYVSEQDLEDILRSFKIDVRIIGEVALSMKATDVFSVKTTYQIEHATLPLEGFRSTDQTMAFTLVASMFGLPSLNRRASN